ncbi:hypothetical protein MTR67_007683 [Solanum verrucosum]|uniref:Uncharacterized protein n=1 Tax=Solanum verrucosum TaxID=315347 RepID=A0AAF0Q0N7_SOLVR|nr:hypothetical protein MTR67_007683 [Solanum verrucosum]
MIIFQIITLHLNGLLGVKKSKLKRSKDEGLSLAMKLFEIENNRLGKMLSESATSNQQDGERLDRYIKAKEFRDETKILMKNLETISDPNVRDYLLNNEYLKKEIDNHNRNHNHNRNNSRNHILIFFLNSAKSVSRPKLKGCN